MANIDLNNFRVTKLGNADIERNYINDILHAIADKLSALSPGTPAIPPPPAPPSGGGGGASPLPYSFITSQAESLPEARILYGEPDVVSVVDNGPSSTVIVGLVDGGVGTLKIATGSIVGDKIPDMSILAKKLTATNTPANGQIPIFDSATGAVTWGAAPSSYTDANARNAVGGILLDSNSIDFTYITNTSIKADVKLSGSTLQTLSTGLIVANAGITSTQLSPTAVPSQAEAELGTGTTPRAFSAQRVNQAIQALAPIAGLVAGTDILISGSSRTPTISYAGGTSQSSVVNPYTITASSVWQDIGTSATVLTTGTYLVTASVPCTIRVADITGAIYVRLVGPSGTYIPCTPTRAITSYVSGQTCTGTAFVSATIVLTAGQTVKLQAYRATSFGLYTTSDVIYNAGLDEGCLTLIKLRS